MPFDFKKLLVVPPDPELVRDYTEATWADIGRRLHDNLMSERYLTAVNIACLTAGASPQPVHHLAACVRAYIFSGTITR